MRWDRGGEEVGQFGLPRLLRGRGGFGFSRYKSKMSTRCVAKRVVAVVRKGPENGRGQYLSTFEGTTTCCAV